MKKLAEYIQLHPLRFLLFIGFIPRLLAAIFSKGYGMVDDHFVVIEIAQGFVDGHDIGNWLPKEGEDNASKRSVLYTGLHYYLFLFLEWIGITGAQFKMYIVRLIHAAYSLLTIHFGYKIALKLSNKNTAFTIGLLLALFWFMPVLSVRNLIEVACIPLLMIAGYHLIIAEEKKSPLTYFLLVGIALGFAFSIRYQTLFFTGGAGIALLLMKKWKECITVAIGVLMPMVFIHGFIEGTIMGYPFFGKVINYVQYNMINKSLYGTQPWYNYILMLTGLLVLPISLFIQFGFFRNWKKHLVLFLPTLIFFIFHSYFPNKQERFILPIIPFIIILGYMGWDEFRKHSGFWNKNQKLLKGFWFFFWVFNFTFLLLTSTFYTKRARVEAMRYLSTKNDVENIIVENSNRNGTVSMPLFYSEQWPAEFELNKTFNLDSLTLELNNVEADSLPNYIVFIDDKNLKQRVAALKPLYSNLKFEKEVRTSFMDKVLHWLNPKNKNEEIFIYKIES
ncbi:MAG: mannosyltransferase [Bacteroidia bacterium]|nr:glycosyltransferase family 39 protein [Bacteroidia bacterium]NNC85410.1 mannosyltransferase [Bacteroidia bacterium]NNM16138.1 mannosyltransferase [Bacteroidia bacterium]